MITCQNGQIEVREKNGKEWFYLRLYLIDDSVHGRKKYKNKYIDTGLAATKRNRVKANQLLAEEISSYTEVGKDMKFSAYCQQWFESKCLQTEINTSEGYAYRLKHITSYFDDMNFSLGEITPQDVKDFYNYLLTKPKSRTSYAQRSEVGLSNRTVKDIASLLRSILKEAYELGHITKNPAARVKVPKKPEDQKDPSFIDVDEVPVFLNAIHGHPLEEVFTVALYYGLRREEICGLKWSAIRDGQIFIEHTVTKMKTTIAKDRTKSFASYRSCPLLPKIELMLNDIKSRQELFKRVMGNQYFDSDYVFTWNDGRPYSPDYITKNFKKIVRANDDLDSDLKLHDLRASCVSMLINSGMDIKSVQKWVGHKDMQTTMNVYARTNKKRQTKVAEAMENIIFT